MRIITMDPVTLNDVKDISNAPYATEGEGEQLMLIYFETEASKQEYMDMKVHGSEDILAQRH